MEDRVRDGGGGCCYKSVTKYPCSTATDHYLDYGGRYKTYTNDKIV